MRNKLIIIASLTLGLLGLSAGIAYASIPDSGGVIHGCYKPQGNGSNAALGVIDTALSGGHCPTGDTALNWNQTGPQGPQGPTGATGATGPQGAAGPSTGGSSGLDLQIVRAENTLVPPGTWTPSTVEATCPSDHPFLFGGGGFADNVGAIPGMPDSGPASSEAEDGTGPHGWTVSGGNNHIVAWAICGK